MVCLDSKIGIAVPLCIPVGQRTCAKNGSAACQAQCDLDRTKQSALPHPNLGTVCVGDSADTLGFAVDYVETWWRTEGRARYLGGTELLILADSGGSDGCRPRAW